MSTDVTWCKQQHMNITSSNWGWRIYFLNKEKTKYVTTFLDEKLTTQVKHCGYHGNDGDILYSELESILNRDASSSLAMYCFEPQKSQFISNLIDRSYRLSQLWCPQLAELAFPVVTCTFPSHNKSNYFGDATIKMSWGCVSRISVRLLNVVPLFFILFFIWVFVMLRMAWFFFLFNSLYLFCNSSNVFVLLCFFYSLCFIYNALDFLLFFVCFIILYICL